MLKLLRRRKKKPLKWAEFLDAIIEWADDEFYPSCVVEKFGVTLAKAKKALKELHDTGRLVCEDGCPKCTVE